MPSKKQVKQLSESWDKILKEQRKPLLDKNKYGRASGQVVKALRPSDVLKRNADRIPAKSLSIVGTDSIVYGKNAAVQPQMSMEEYQFREARAKDVKHCVMPLHKGGYILVTDEEMIKQMGKKTA